MLHVCSLRLNLPNSVSLSDGGVEQHCQLLKPKKLCLFLFIICRLYRFYLSAFLLQNQPECFSKKIKNKSQTASLTCTALQWDAVALAEPVSWAAFEASICCCTGDADCRTGFTSFPCRMEEPLWTSISTLTLEEVPRNPKLI